MFWCWGATDPAAYARAERAGAIDRNIPTIHSPLFAPVIHPTLEQGVANLTVAAREFLD